MTHDKQRMDAIEKALQDGDGILRLKPAWVARNFLVPGFRLGLSEEEANEGERGYITERWLASETAADNPIKVEGEGLSFLVLDGTDAKISLKEAVQCMPGQILGEDYAQEYGAGLNRLAKLFDYGDRLPYHIHQQQQDAEKVGANAKEEAYYFPTGADMGPHPETFIGCHPHIVEEGRQEEVFLPFLRSWDGDAILQFAPAYKQIPGDGFHVPSGTLHAPGSALTFELQEDSDVFAMLQAKVSEFPIAKELLYKDVTDEDKQSLQEAAVLRQINWEVSADPYKYENRHTPPVRLKETDTGVEDWIFYNTDKFSGIRLRVKPEASYTSQDNGVYSVFVWRGRGTIGGHAVEGEDPNMDELLVTHSRATQPLEIVNTGDCELEIWKVFGKGVNLECPRLKTYKG